MCCRYSSLVLLFFVLFYTSCSKDSGSSEVQPPVDTTTTPTQPVDTSLSAKIYDNDNILLGNPSSATLADDNNYLMVKGAYDLSFNRSRGTANWVSWHLYNADLGSISRSDDFEPDPALPFSWYAITSASYSNTGFDRGHTCPSGDRTATTTANQSTFYMTNIIPQAPKLNQGAWNDFENYTRSLLSSGDEEYIVMGSYGEGGTGTNGYIKTIDYGNVTVPATIWKVIVIIGNGDNDTSRITASTRVIAVQIPNDNGIGANDWKTYRTSVDAIETATGLDLLSRLPLNIQAAIEAKVDTQ